MNIPEIVIAVIANTLICNQLGRYFTEVRRPLLPFKPFNCRGCFTFWLTQLGGAAIAFCISPAWAVMVFTVYLGLINFYYVKSKTIILP